MLAFRSILGTLPVHRVEFVDPGGMTSTTDLMDDGHVLRVRVQSTHGERSRAGRFIDSAGSGVLHLAFVVDDLAAVAAAIAPGLALDIPANYYCDLQARFGLADAVVGPMKEANVLFERSAEGDLLRIVCQPGVGVSIGFVERRGFTALPHDSEGAVAAALHLRAERATRGAS